MRIYKYVYCQTCGAEIILEFDGTFYNGYCSICEQEIVETAYGDEEDIEENYGR
jgi:hypothetical protein